LDAGWLAMIPLLEEDRAVAKACAPVMIRRARSADHFGQDSLESHYHGALGEIAFSKFLGVPWRCHPGEGAQPDVAGYEVRTVGPRTPYYVKAKPEDRGRIASVVLLADCQSALIVGWITVDEVKKYGRWEDWGNRGASAWMLKDPTKLHRSFPELDNPVDSRS
jgi:hypothetical protein